METPDDNKICAAQSCSHLVHVRLGKQERALLLAARGGDWTPLEVWKCGERAGKAALEAGRQRLDHQPHRAGAPRLGGAARPEIAHLPGDETVTTANLCAESRRAKQSL